MIKLYHFTEEKNVKSILENGLIAMSRYESLTPLRDNVVFCWLSPDHNKMSFDSQACLEVTVDEKLCTVCDMEYISLAMMYKYGGKKFNQYGVFNTPVNIEASELFIKIYEVTAVPFEQYNNHFFTPEVLVKWNIPPQNIKLFS